MEVLIAFFIPSWLCVPLIAKASSVFPLCLWIVWLIPVDVVKGVMFCSIVANFALKVWNVSGDWVLKVKCLFISKANILPCP